MKNGMWVLFDAAFTKEVASIGVEVCSGRWVKECYCGQQKLQESVSRSNGLNDKPRTRPMTIATKDFAEREIMNRNVVCNNKDSSLWKIEV